MGSNPILSSKGGMMRVKRRVAKYIGKKVARKIIAGKKKKKFSKKK
jgi:hypothetical protein